MKKLTFPGFLCNIHHFVHQPRSPLTNIQRDGGVGIWAPKQFTVKMRNDLNTINGRFFESMWIEIGKLLTLINIAYCPNVNLLKIFPDKMTVEVSNVHSYTDNLILFGDFNIKLLGAKGTESQQAMGYFSQQAMGYFTLMKRRQHGQMLKNVC